MAHAQKRIRNGKTRWVARWTQPDGAERSRTFDTKKEAEAHAFAEEAKSSRRVDLDARRQMTVGEWLDEWLDEHIAARAAAGQIAPRTASGYESDVRVWLNPKLGPFPLVDLQVADVNQMLTAIMAAGRSPGTARSIRATLSAALTTAGEAGLVDRNAARLAAAPTLPTPQPTSFSIGELDRILPVAYDHRLGTVVAWSVLTDLRASELCGFRWVDVDFEQLQFRVAVTTHRIPRAAARVVPETGLVDSKPKNEASGRLRKMPPLAAEVLRDQRRRQATERLQAEVWHDSGRVWTQPDGTKVSADQLRNAHYEILAAAGVPRTNKHGKPRALHELRRTWTERQRRAGIPPEDSARLGGWSSPQTMMRHYAASPDDRMDAAAQAAEDGLTWGAG